MTWPTKNFGLPRARQKRPPLSTGQEGFTLVELTIVLVIVALLIGGMLVPLSAQKDLQNASETQRQLSEAKEALYGFAAANGRLPCPASADTSGVENPAGGGAPCVNAWNGFLPGITLGVGPTDAQGYVVDNWGNRIRYAVTAANASAYTTTNGLKGIWGTGAPLVPDLRVCSTSVGIGAECAGGAEISSNAVAVLFSTGKNGAVVPPIGADELANSGTRRSFVTHEQAPSTAAQGEFDDLVTWISPNILYNRMISAGRLP